MSERIPTPVPRVPNDVAYTYAAGPLPRPIRPPLQPMSLNAGGFGFLSPKSPHGPKLSYRPFRRPENTTPAVFTPNQNESPVGGPTASRHPFCLGHRRNSASWPSVGGFPTALDNPVHNRLSRAINGIRTPTPTPSRLPAYLRPQCPSPEPSPQEDVGGGSFRPMSAIADTEGRRRAVTVSSNPLVPAVTTNLFSINYRGEHNVRNASACHLPPEENCALWLTNLPPDVTHTELLAQIRGVGRIYCTVINQPDYEKHSTAAAKVAFFDPQSAQRLLSLAVTQGITVRGHMVKVTHNRVKYAAQVGTTNETRVLIITGKSTFVNETSLKAFFKERFIFEMDRFRSLMTVGKRSVVEFSFGSYRCQAQMGKMALEKDLPEGLERVEFGPDPCEVGDDLSVYGIAGARIQGI